MFYCPYYEQMIDDYYRAKQMNPYIRVFHASPNAPAVDVYANGNLLVKNLSYKEVSQYLPVPAGTYAFKINVAGTNNTALTVPNVRLDDSTYYTICAVGLVGQSPPLEVVLLTEPR